MRPDGKRLKRTNPMYTVVPYIMNKRYDSMNMIELDIPLDPIQNYLNQKRKEGITLSHMGLLLAAYVRTAAEFPSLNRFIVNKKIYARNEFNVALVVLKQGEHDNGTMSKVNFELEDTIFDVQRKIDNYVAKNRAAEGKNSTDKMINFLLSIPGVLPLGVGLFKWLDKHGLLPRSIIEASPFHASLCISNLASIRTRHIYHHIYDFGTIGVFITMGIPREVPKTSNGTIILEKCLPLGIVMDERICSGSYFASAFRRFSKYLKNPELLEIPPEPDKVIKEVPYRKISE